MGEQGVLDNVQDDAFVEALAAEFACLSSIQASDIRDVKVGILLKLR